MLSLRFLRRATFVWLYVFLLAVTIHPAALHAQTYTDLHDFNGSPDGGNGLYEGLVAQGRDGNLYGTLPKGGSSGLGTVYKITPSGVVTALYTFSGPDGEAPYGGLTLGTDGNFYGTTSDDSVHGWGTIFKISPDGTLTTLHGFTGPDGCAPYGPPVQGKKGLVFYGVTQGCSTAYTTTPSGTFKLLPNALPNYPYGALILASDGNFYGTSFQGGNSGNGTVYKLSAGGAVTVIYNFDFTHGAGPLGPLVQGSDGNLYGTTENGGTAANPGGVVFKMTLKGTITVLHNFDLYSATDGSNPSAGLVAGSDGNFYSGTFDSLSGGADRYGNLYKITPGGTYSNLHDFDFTHGAGMEATPMQHTTGIVYGEASGGGADGYGVFWKLNAALSPFVSIVGFPAATSGTTVEILGQGFSSATSVKFGSGSAAFSVVNNTYMTATVPSSGTTGPVTVKTSSGTLASKQTFKVLPVLSSFTPASGPVGTHVTISGSGFVGTTSVTFNGVKASFTVNSGTEITATVPSGASTGKIGVTTPGGKAMSSGTFTVT